MTRDEWTPRRRFFVPALGSQHVTLDETEAHHAAHVLRLKVGAAVELFDGQGGRAVGEVTEVRRGSLSVEIDSRSEAMPRPRPALHLGFAVPKGKRLDWLLEKATELGAASLCPVVFERSVAGGKELSLAKQERWLGHCISAAKQCGLDWLPEIRPARRLAEFLVEFGGKDWLGLLGDAGPSTQSLPAAFASRDQRDVCILVGPEGGLSDAERQEALAAGFIPVRLGQTILRIETAALALLAGASAICGHGHEE